MTQKQTHPLHNVDHSDPLTQKPQSFITMIALTSSPQIQTLHQWNVKKPQALSHCQHLRS